jgi:hypothetical protein
MINTVNTTFEQLIVVIHSGIGKVITREECVKALPKGLSVPIEWIEFKFPELELANLYEAPFDQLALEQQRQFNADVKPLMDKNPNATIAYFGLAPIPLAVHLGYLFNNFKLLWVYQFHHEEKMWYREIEPLVGYQFKVKPLNLPEKVEKGKGDVFIRISTSYRIEPQHTYEIISNPTNEFDLSLQHPHPDSISNEQQLDELASSFLDILGAISNFLPDRDKIHLFISASTGLPFLLGTKINPTIFPYIQTYQFDKEQTPKYQAAILISKFIREEPVFTLNERKTAAKTRKRWALELKDKIIPYMKLLQPKDYWIDYIDPSGQLKQLQISDNWRNLPTLNQTYLISDSINLDKKVVNDGFRYDYGHSEWWLDDSFLIMVEKRFKLKAGSDLHQAGRLFLFHEALHYAPAGHNITEEIATGIGRFPNVIEEADYQADVWAILNDYGYACQYTANSVALENPKKYVLDAIDSAVETMWSFVDNGTEITEIQIRSMKRFLNWYWQYVRIERLPGKGTLSSVAEILFQKPIVELAGAEILSRNQRIYMKLDKKVTGAIELSTFIKNKIHRFSPVLVDEILTGLKEMNGDLIKKGLRGFNVILG